ncbi:hypothetical protein [Sphingomonas nostoxanthinifaciens]|uniref:hypothetical protein n=1 Tax=Sphingomonas nostoxanthinifaciens TaxID=2872652 RepID=UPI001CC1ED7B|nr:hypothetical protein [Sphingomonas nostoxanthinifaciens]UAK25562.1 hypothetical protein K8P63_05245 [Sphingomonas nostoxanthinifaciens]
MALTDEELRDAATHRGLKLVKSRKRNAGVGDYGKFGLTDPAGKSLFGIGDDGLTASAEEIEDYLRRGEVSTWAESARITPQAVSKAKTSKDDVPEATSSAIRPRPHRGGASSASRLPAGVAEASANQAKARANDDEATRFERRPMRTAPEAPPPVPKLTIRQARASDAEAVSKLLATGGFEGGAAAARRAIASASARKESILVADRSNVIGILAWTVIADVLAGAVGRISVIVVDEHDRRDGVGKAVVEEFGKRKVGLIEGMSDIEIRNANGFLRALGLRQGSYRFVARI